MNIGTPYPAINLNTANVHTETARRDNQQREVIPAPKAMAASNTDNKAANEHDKSRLNSQSEALNEQKSTHDHKRIGDQPSDADQQHADQQSKNQQQNQQQSQQEQQQLQKLKARDTEVRAHEQAHAAVGGKYAGSPSYTYQRGSDGKSYAVGGEVPIDVGIIENDPKATIDKMQTVRAAALAPAQPSGADRAIAADAAQKLAAAQMELSQADKSEQTAESTKGERSESATPSFSRDEEIEQRASRIGQFYQRVAAPFTPPRFSAQS